MSMAAKAMATVPHLQSIDLTIKLALFPSACADAMGAIKAHVNKHLFKYDESLGGIPLAYGDINFAPGKEYGRIHIDQPWIYVEAEVSKMLIFCPVVGTVLQGRISKVSAFHLSFCFHTAHCSA